MNATSSGIRNSRTNHSKAAARSWKIPGGFQQGSWAIRKNFWKSILRFGDSGELWRYPGDERKAIAMVLIHVSPMPNRVMVKNGIPELSQLIGAGRNFIAGTHRVNAIWEGGLYESRPMPVVARVRKTGPKSKTQFPY
jgi:hypothetical protein